MKIDGASRVVVAQDELQPLARILTDEIALLTGLKLPTAVGKGQPGDIVLRINQGVQADEAILAIRNRQTVRTKDGAHRLTVGEQALVEGFDHRAVAEGSATLLQALGLSGGQVSLPRLIIHDWPHADYCGMMVDVGRQDHPIDWLKKMVEVCRFYKVRYLQLHLTDDQGWTFPSTKYPQLGSKNYGAHGGKAPKVYTLEELRGLVAFADARGVTLVPEVEMPGHSGAALRSFPEVFDAIDPKTKQPVGMGCMNMANEALYPVLDTLIGEICDVFRSSPFFHLGGDEVSMGRVSLHPGYKAFMDKHQLKDDAELGAHFIRQVGDLIRKHGKKALKWEGLANEASKDIIVVCWDKNNNMARQLLDKGFSVLTCPWDLGVPWDEWNMYICNGSKMKSGEQVFGATLVAWEQPPAFHLAGVRNVASRQERTWNPFHKVTEQGFATRHRSLDAAVGKLLRMPVQPRLEAALTASAGVKDHLDPAFALDGDEATFHQSDKVPAAGDHFTLTFPEPRLLYGLEVLTGVNRRGMFEGGQVQVSVDGKEFKTVATLQKGMAQAVLKENRVKAVRLLAVSQQFDQVVVREINLRLLVEVAEVVKNPTAVIGAGNVAQLRADAVFAYPMNECALSVINPGFKLTLNNGGNPSQYSGPIRGKGTVEIHQGARQGAFKDAPMVFSGKAPNTFDGTWVVKAGRLVLAKDAGVQALAGTIVVGGQGDNDGVVWSQSDQVHDGAEVRLETSPQGNSYLDLQGHNDAFAVLTMHAGNRILTDGPAGGGVLSVSRLLLDGKPLAKGIYTSASPWVRGGGYVLVGDVKTVKLSGTIEPPNPTVHAGDLAILEGPSVVKLPAGALTTAFNTRNFPLTIIAEEPARLQGFITGHGAVRLDARSTLVISGDAPNSYKGITTVARGVVKLNKAGVLAIPGNLEVGGSSPASKDSGVEWGADGQLSPAAVVTMGGEQPSFLDLSGHQAAVAKVYMSKAGMIRTGAGGALQVKQLHVAGKRLADGVYQTPQTWLQGSGKVVVDARVEVQGVIGDCMTRIGAGNIANLTGKTSFSYPVGDCDLDVITNGHALTLDSGNGNPLNYRGTISGTGDVLLFMGPSYTDYKDAPLRLTGDKPNTTSGKFHVRKGRVQLEKPDGVDAISGDVLVGGQGFNDCLFWVNSNQIKDSAHITLLSAGSNGSAYLHLNGCRETVAGLKLSAGNAVKTDAANGGAAGVLTVRTLVVDGVQKAAGTYTAATEKWIEGKGSVVVTP